MAATYVTLESALRAGLYANKTVVPSDVTFKLVRASNRAEIAAAKGKWTSGKPGETASRDTLSNSVQSFLPIDQAIVDEVLGQDKMSEELRVDCLYKGNTFPGRDVYVLWRNRIKVLAKRKKGGNPVAAKHAAFDCKIESPPGYTGGSAPSQGWVIGDNGEVDVQLGAPGDVTLEWRTPFRFVKWLDAKSGKGPKVEAMLEPFHPAAFVWPRPAPPPKRGDASPPCRQYVNLTAVADQGEDLSGRANGKKMKIRVGKGAAGLKDDTVFVKAAVSGPDAQTIDAKDVSITFDGAELKIGASRICTAKTLPKDEGFVDVEIDFKGQGGITLTLSVGSSKTLFGSEIFDETVVVQSWRRVDVQAYSPADKFLSADNNLPSAISDLVVEAFRKVFIETKVLPSKDLLATFGAIEDPKKFQVVRISREHALAVDAGLEAVRTNRQGVLKPGAATGDAAVVWFHNDPGYEPNSFVKTNTPNKQVFTGKHHVVHMVIANHLYQDQEETVKLPVEHQSKERAKELKDRKAELEKEIEDGREPYGSELKDVQAQYQSIHTDKVVASKNQRDVIADKLRKLPPRDTRNEQQKEQAKAMDEESAALRLKEQEGDREKAPLARRRDELKELIELADTGPLQAQNAELKGVNEQLATMEFSFTGVESAELKTTHYLFQKDLDITRGNATGKIVLPGSYWETADKAHRGDITTDAFIKPTGLKTYKIVLPDTPGSPRQYLGAGAITIKLKFKTISLGNAGGSGPGNPIIFLTWNNGDVGRAAFVVIHEVGHLLEQASDDTPGAFKLGGPHCCAGQEAVKGGDSSKKAYAVVAAGNFGTCVMWTPTGDTVSDALHAAACVFCPNCARILRLHDLTATIGDRDWTAA